MDFIRISIGIVRIRIGDFLGRDPLNGNCSIRINPIRIRTDSFFAPGLSELKAAELGLDFADPVSFPRNQATF